MFENPNTNAAERKPSAEELRMKQAMQRTLMYDYIKAKGLSPDDDITSILVDWVDKFAPEFDTMLKGLMQDDPELLEKWRSHSDSVMHTIREKMSPASQGQEAERKAA